MATAILRSHDCLRDQFPSSRRLRNPNPNSNCRTMNSNSNNQSSRCRRRKRSPSDGNRRSNRDSLFSSPPSKGLVMENVKILKRGEELKARMLFGGENVDLGLQLCSTDRLGPDPDVVKKQIRVPDLYAGTTSMVSSPHPSSLPFPKALVRRNTVENDLRKLLRI